jgi:hypothetical protein
MDQFVRRERWVAELVRLLGAWTTGFISGCLYPCPSALDAAVAAPSLQPVRPCLAIETHGVRTCSSITASVTMRQCRACGSLGGQEEPGGTVERGQVGVKPWVHCFSRASCLQPIATNLQSSFICSLHQRELQTINGAPGPQEEPCRHIITRRGLSVCASLPPNGAYGKPSPRHI